jgi:single-strand DNA-binding protein
MARGTVNKVILIGRLGADPEVRYSQGGTAIAKISVATNERVPAGEGNWEDRTEWHRVVAFGKTAENCGTYLSKGKQVYIEGRLQTRQWDDAQGVKHYTTEIVAREIQFLGGADQSTQQAQSNQSTLRSDSPQVYGDRPLTEELPPPPAGGIPEEDIPF